jgi:hypothetical protein
MAAEDWDRKAALERPDLVDAFDIEVDETVFDRDANHARLPVESGKKLLPVSTLRW